MRIIRKFYFYFRKEKKYKLLKKLGIHEWDWCCNKTALLQKRQIKSYFIIKKI